MSDQTGNEQSSLLSNTGASQETPESTTPESNSNDELTTLLASIKNEDGQPKYKDIPTALKSLAASQDYIKQLKSDIEQRDNQLTSVQSQLQEATTVEDFVNRLTTQQQEPSEQPTEQPSAPEGNGFDEALIEEYLAKREAKASQEKNITAVRNAIATAYGDEADAKLQAKAAELGMSLNDISELATRSSTAAIKLLGLDSTTTATKPNTNGTINSTAFQRAPEPQQAQKTAPSMLRGATSQQSIDYIRALRAEITGN